ncbi:uncharacterized protein OCT59_005073 [Rhizophagus irregularis]|uniref:Uncharacterized protein n=1 Tax=Rhizophagus irregularis TaxID=588596 RepID=A0A916DYW7_9GLOM|nr:hypothetical protein OCT59_005073 [Rhizophagus irregularis]GBC21411.2 hypothetical protein GLOIN_2v1809500 [Rhizophagus irregularis DAOM 181602=DAOM 197198]CAB4488491.1 unnamed protein product [Rhizophagus irregularis]CAB5174071.1 unnamed protein product [Rhizophagus irregularis]CAB5312084.1 unnamed protein product [Rhizophagus irregularis]
MVNFPILSLKKETGIKTSGFKNKQLNDCAISMITSNKSEQILGGLVVISFISSERNDNSIMLNTLKLLNDDDIHVIVQGKEKWCVVCDKTFESKNDHVNNDLTRHNILVDNKNITESSGDMIDGYDYDNDQDYYEFENDENENETEESKSLFDDDDFFSDRTIKKNIMKAYKVLYTFQIAIHRIDYVLED